MYDAIIDWERLCKGKDIFSPDLRNIYSFMEIGGEITKGYGPKSKKLLKFDPEIPINMQTAINSLGLKINENKEWNKALSKIDDGTRHYILNALKRGEDIKNPRIMVSTIHSMKGGECDNIVVVPDLSGAAYKEYHKNPNTEHRVYYVAVTRAKKSLHIMEPAFDEFYSL
jgi:hypothetical protein